MAEPIARDRAAAASIRHGAAIILEPLRDFLDAAGLGAGELRAEELGDGHSNLTFLLLRGGERMVFRRPPRGALSSSANDVLRETRILAALEPTEVPVPEVLAQCDDAGVIGCPFFIMSYVDGVPINSELPAEFDGPGSAEQIAALAAIHAADLDQNGLGAFGRSSGYLERQLHRFSELLESNATRPLLDLEAVWDWLMTHLPEAGRTTLVHGDVRLGNLLFAAPLRLSAVLDWEMATVGDPLADLGYLTAMWPGPTDPENPMFALSRVTRRPGFPDRAEIARSYEAATGEAIDDLLWYQVLALWKAAIFLEGSYRRFSAGASTDPFFHSLDLGVPALARTAHEWTRSAG